MLKRLALWMLVAAAMLALYKLPLEQGGEHDFDSLEVHRTEVNGVELAYRTVGAGKPLLLVMGYSGTMEMWAPELIQELAADRQVIMFDNRGMGESAVDERRFSIGLFASDASVLVKRLGFEKVDVLGWSMGAITAARMAAEYPERVDKLILYGGACDRKPVVSALNRMNKLPQDELIRKIFPHAWVSKHPEAYDNLPEPSSPIDAKIVKRQYEALSDWHGSRALLSSIESPTLIVSGENDWVTPVDQSVDMAELIPGSWLARFKGAGHWLMYQYPVGMAEVVNNFLSVDQNLVN